MNAKHRTLTLVTCLAVFASLGSLWWWALNDMSDEVGTAWALTCAGLWGLALLLWVEGDT